MKQIVVGTAGHIDHGKTALIKSLTGIDADRLKEEKERGITIDLGFAHLDLDKDLHLGIVDVPGHERFVRNMLAGVGGIDLVLMVIAVDEGVMPQTREHLAICELLRIKEGLVVLTKADLVEGEWLEIVREDVEDFLKGTFLEGRPVVPVSSRTGQGLDVLLKELAVLASTIPPKSEAGTFRLPIDRVFSIRGFGTVVTGTLLSGSVALDSPVMIYPKGLPARVRGIQIHNRSVNKALAGQRTAVNLQGLGKEELERGGVLSHPGGLQSTYMADISFRLLPDSPWSLKDRARVRFHHGTNEILGRIHFLDREELLPAEEAYAQIRLESPLAALPKDRYVIRSYSPIQTIGGGEILEVAPRKLRRSRKDLVHHFDILEKGSEMQIIAHQLQQAGINGLKSAGLIPRTSLPSERLKVLSKDMIREGQVVAVQEDGTWLVHTSCYTQFIDELIGYLKTFHARFALKLGMSKEELKSKSRLVEDRIFLKALKDLDRKGRIVIQGEKVRLAEHRVQLAGRQGKLKTDIEKEYCQGGVQPPDLGKVFEKLSVRRPEEKELIHVLLEEDRLVRIKGDLYYHRGVLDQMEGKLKAFLQAHEEINPGQFKDLFGVSRKYAIPLLEYFDGCKVTMRLGDKRVLWDR